MMVTCQVSLVNLECDYLLPIRGEKNLHIAYINYSSYVSVRVIYLNLDYSGYDNNDVWNTFWLVSLLRVIQILKIFACNRISKCNKLHLVRVVRP